MDEPVVKETDDSDDPIPIINSKRLENILHLFQYPLRQKDCANEHNIKKCFYKPQSEEVKLELAINVESPNFDVGRAEIIAHEVDGEIDDVFFENAIVDKVFLQSTKVVKEPNKYAIAAYNGKEIHLTALKGMFQFRPHFPYMDKGVKRKKEAESAAESDEEQAGPSNAQQVTVKFKQNDDRWKKSRENSQKCRGNVDSMHLVERLKLISDNTDDNSQANTLGDIEYVKLLVPQDQESP
ncbi:hypothetical protein NQ318_004917 [Aromia moschata]|uniref:Uncharacterized protein n=1 Tax=Aromia moschata TaxID=1265417 RepID=A0AAV8Z1P0_9CUCU|nr:hypothetical protein NQ318_004917 [Aromia moschata]